MGGQKRRSKRRHKTLFQNENELSQNQIDLDKNRFKTHTSKLENSEIFIQQAIEAIKKIPLTCRPKIEVKTTHLSFSANGVQGEIKENHAHQTKEIPYPIPDVYVFIQNEIDLTRQTIFDILIQSDRYEELEINPQMFLDNVVLSLKKTFEELMKR